jgi:hypothetical protein
MSTQTPTPNEDGPRHVDDPQTQRNDPAIDPEGKVPASGGDGAPTGATGKAPATDDKAKANDYSPDFAPEPDTSKSGVAKDADIDTDGG